MESLGEKIFTINLIRSRYILLSLLALGAAGLLLFLVSPASHLGNENFFICIGPVAFVFGVIGLILLWRSFWQLSVSVHRDGLAVKQLLGTDIIRWDDISEISYFNLIYVRRDRGFPLPIIFPTLIMLIGIIRLGAGTSHIFESTYLFRLRDGRKKSLAHDARLFELAKPISEGTFPFLVRDAVQRLKRGEELFLHDRVSYSLSGLKGFIVKGTHSRKRQAPFQISWDQYTGYTIDEDRLVLKSEKKPLTTLAPIEVRNLHVFHYLAPILRRGDMQELAALADGASSRKPLEN